MTQITEALEAARAHILDAYRIWQADDVSAVPPPKSGAGAVIAKIDAVLSSPIAVEGKVKALEWRNGYRDWQVKIQTASSGPFYQVRELDGVVWLDADNTQTIYPSVDAAKAAAQSDYETRSLSALISSRGEPCPHCKGEGCQTGDPEGAPLEACDYCNGSGKKISTQPASTALVERLKERGQAFANQVRLITHLLHGQAYSTTVAELNAFDAVLSSSTSSEGESR